MEGVEFVSCFPMNPVLDAIAAEGIRLITARTERVAVGIADGYTRASFGRRHGVSLVQSGPGCENAFSAVAQACGDSVPILFMPGGPGRTFASFRLEAVGPGSAALSASRQAGRVPRAPTATAPAAPRRNSRRLRKRVGSVTSRSGRSSCAGRWRMSKANPSVRGWETGRRPRGSRAVGARRPGRRRSVRFRALSRDTSDQLEK